MIHLPRPTVRSSLCLALIIGGWYLTACEFLPSRDRDHLAASLARAGDIAGSALIATGHPGALLLGGTLIAGGHAAAGIIRHNRPTRAPKTKRPRKGTGAR